MIKIKQQKTKKSLENLINIGKFEAAGDYANFFKVSEKELQIIMINIYNKKINEMKNILEECIKKNKLDEKIFEIMQITDKIIKKYNNLNEEKFQDIIAKFSKFCMEKKDYHNAYNFMEFSNNEEIKQEALVKYLQSFKKN